MFTLLNGVFIACGLTKRSQMRAAPIACFGSNKGDWVMHLADLRHKLLRTTMLGGLSALMATSAAVAQDDIVDDEELEERMVVTGSRLSGSPVSAAAPVIQVSSEDIQLRGITQVEDYINLLPSAFAGQTSEVANGSNGASSINLRGLGSSRTLSLIDGKRLPYGALTQAAGNVDLVPAQLIERVDIVTGGASAVYGSDAIAGVVNFVLKDDFEGFEVDVQGSYFHDMNDNEFAQDALAASEIPIPDSLFDGARVNVSAIFGANTADDRGNVTLYFQYFRQQDMIGGDHDVGACTLRSFGCAGSSNFRRVNSNTGEGAFFQQEDGTLVPLTITPETTFNFGAFNFYQRPVERFTIYSKAHYEFTDFLRGYIEVQYQDNNTDAQIAPSASFNRNFSVNCDNPFLSEGLSPGGEGGRTYFDILGCDGLAPDAVVPFIHSHRNVEGLPRVSTFDFGTFRVVGGIDGSFHEDTFTYDLFGQFAQTRVDDISRGDLAVEKVQQALFVTTDANGNAVCTDASGGCVPWNIFSRPGGNTGVTPEAAAFVQGTGITVGTIEQVVIGGTLSGDLGKFGYVSPWAEEGIQALGGFEFRGDTLDRVPDEITIAGSSGLTGVGGGTPPLTGEVRVWEAFTEVKIPLIQGQPLIQDLTIQGAYRYSDYTTEDSLGNTGSFDATTFNAGVTWAPVEDIRFRAQFQRAIRAPNVFELFLTPDSGLFDLENEDPCSGDFNPNTPAPEPAATLEQCMRTGLTAAQYGTVEQSAAGQYNQIVGGNPDLQPEESDTITAGVVITPSFVDDLTITVDYFNIEITDYINPVPPAVTLQNCLDSGDPLFCNNIRRDSLGTLWLLANTADGELAGVVATDQNIAEYSTDGIDININYTHDLNDLGWGNLGAFNINYAATYLLSLDFTAFPGSPTTECVGRYRAPCTGSGSVVGVPTPEYRHLASFTWQSPYDLDVRLTWRHQGDAEEIGGGDPLGSFNYLDVAFGWQIRDDLRFRAGVNNVFDTDPPFVFDPGTGQGNNNTFPGVYPSTGRFLFFGATFTR